jgi:hypothetical protein
MNQQGTVMPSFSCKFIFNTTDEVIAALERAAKDAGTNKSWVARNVLTSWLDENGYLAPAREAPAPRLRDRDGSWDGAEL